MSEVEGSAVGRSEAEGGCFCGGLRYRVVGEPSETCYCHCRMCQRSVGAPVTVWGTWDVGQFAWIVGQAKTLASSELGERLFCPDCGTHILFRNRAMPTSVDLNLASLDDPLQFPPRSHVWTDSRLSWFEIGDELPQYPQSSAMTLVPSASVDEDGH